MEAWIIIIIAPLAISIAMLALNRIEKRRFRQEESTRQQKYEARRNGLTKKYSDWFVFEESGILVFRIPKSANHLDIAEFMIQTNTAELMVYGQIETEHDTLVYLLY